MLKEKNWETRKVNQDHSYLVISLLAGEKPGESLLNWVVWIFPKISTGVPAQKGKVKKILRFWAQYMLYIRRLLHRNERKTSIQGSSRHWRFPLVYLMTTCSSAVACFSSYNESWIPIWTFRKQIPENFFWLTTCENCDALLRLDKINNENAFEKETEDWS